MHVHVCICAQNLHLLSEASERSQRTVALGAKRALAAATQLEQVRGNHFFSCPLCFCFAVLFGDFAGLWSSGRLVQGCLCHGK